ARPPAAGAACVVLGAVVFVAAGAVGCAHGSLVFVTDSANRPGNDCRTTGMRQTNREAVGLAWLHDCGAALYPLPSGLGDRGGCGYRSRPQPLAVSGHCGPCRLGCLLALVAGFRRWSRAGIVKGRLPIGIERTL